MKILKTILGGFLIVVLTSCSSTSPRVNHKPNILFIAIDDLRPELGSNGNPIVHSPNLDRLADEGFLFQNHFTNVPTCGPSRYCMLTGMRPTTPAHLRNNIFENMVEQGIDESRPKTFIHLLKQNGYHTSGIGKISHSADGFIYGYNDTISSNRELPQSWSELSFDYGKWKTGWNAFFAYANGENRQSLKKQVRPYESGEVDDLGYPDGLTRKLAQEKLKSLSEKGQPFFLGVGFFKPHLPFTAPKKYWDLYDESQIPISNNPDVPLGINTASLHGSGEFNQYQLGEEQAGIDHNLSDEYAKKLKHAYYACISYIDAQVGLLLDDLKDLGLEENTIVVVWGDHGWHMGDQRIWGKHTIFENALKSVLIIKDPTNKKNREIDEVVETIDIYPTLLDLCGIKTKYEIDGESLLPLLDNLKADEISEIAYGYYRKGISLRTRRYRLTKYFRDERPNIELYDHFLDPSESRNIANIQPTVVDSLMPILEKGNTGLYDD